jgi:dihydrolipoamide dehydrogenase
VADKKCKLLVIGGGPGGYVCAIRAAQLGVDTVLVEAGRAGGTCLNVGCIPSKAIIHAADEFHHACGFADSNALGISAAQPSIDLQQTMQWKDGIVSRLNQGVEGLLKRAGVTLVSGTATFLDGKTVRVEGTAGTSTISAENIVIATGSEPVEIPALAFGDKVMSSTEALSLNTVPSSLAIVGGGYIGLEIGTAYAKLGSEVFVVETAGQILPQYDKRLVDPVAKRLAHLGVEVVTEARATGLTAAGLEYETKDGAKGQVPADKVLVTVGRRPRTDDCQLSELALTMNGAFVQIDNRCQTSMRGVYAIGDVTGDPMLAHRAMAQGEMVAEIVSGLNRSWDKRCIPAVCFTDPEIVCAGLLPSEALAEDYEFDVAQFPFAASGRAMTVEREDGFVRVVAQKSDGVLLGVQAVGAGVSELAASFSLALEMGARVDDIAATIHAHPTLGEAFQEACMQALGHGLHI